FAVIGGAVPIMMKNNEPVRDVVLIEDGPQATGLAGAVRDALAADVVRREAQAREAAEKATEVAGAEVGAAAADSAVAGVIRPRMTLLDTPADLASATGEAREERIRHYLGDEVAEEQQLDAVVILTRNEAGQPTARVWSRRATDNTVRNFVRDAMIEA